VPLHELMEINMPAESSDVIRERVIKARKIQEKRFKGHEQVYCNAQMPDHLTEVFCTVDMFAKKFLYNTIEKLELSARAYSRILKVARTIADLAGSKHIELEHVAEAIHLRCLDKPVVIPERKIKPPFGSRYHVAV
jgi:magnesium chelatase family protein